MRFNSLVLFLALSALSACRSTPKPATAPPTTPPTASVGVGGAYQSGGDCKYGSPENPTCLMSLVLADDGGGRYVGDDIAERLTWTRTGDRVTVVLDSRSFDLQVRADGTLVGDSGMTWTRK
jgi:hypothetical protein